MKQLILAVTASAALLAGTTLAPVAMAQDAPIATPAPQQDGNQPADAPVPPQQAPVPTMGKAVPKKAASDTALVIGGIAATIGVVLAVGGGGSDNDSPSSP